MTSSIKIAIACAWLVLTIFLALCLWIYRPVKTESIYVVGIGFFNAKGKLVANVPGDANFKSWKIEGPYTKRVKYSDGTTKELSDPNWMYMTWGSAL